MWSHAKSTAPKYRVAHKKLPQFSALEKTHVLSIGRIALAIRWSTVCTFLICHASDQNCYIDLLKTSLLPECRRLYLGDEDQVIARIKLTTFRKSSIDQYNSSGHWHDK